MDSHFYKNTSKKKKTAAYRIHVYKLWEICFSSVVYNNETLYILNIKNNFSINNQQANLQGAV
jgi:hypothetical protein